MKQKRNNIKQQLEGIPSSSAPPNQESDLPLMPDFPNELAFEILSRLPAKSLGKFKCVSQPWRSLISSRRFIKTHLALASGREDYGQHRLVITVPSTNPHELHSVSSMLNKAGEAPTDFFVLQKSLDMVGSCNGLVCLLDFYRSWEELFLCNPCTKEFKKLPSLGSQSDEFNIGFGYDSLNDDYKEFGFVSDLHEINLHSLKTDSWRTFNPQFSPRFFVEDASTYFHFVSGKFYWLVVDEVDVYGDGLPNAWKIGCSIWRKKHLRLWTALVTY